MQQASIFDEFESTENTQHNFPHIPTKKETRALLREVQSHDQDFEFYPTCAKQISCIRTDLLKEQSNSSVRHDFGKDKIGLSLLDVGAGDGRVLMSLTEGKRYAIEKSMPLVQAMHDSIMILGSDFLAQSLFEKRVDVIFSNSPYSEFVIWACKIIKEANAALIYLVMPERWIHSKEIAQALAMRHAKAVVLGEYDYLDAHRVARAKVNVVKIKLGTIARHNKSCSDTDAFSLWFDATFSINAPASKATEWETRRKMEEQLKTDIASKSGGELIKREGLVRMLETLYNHQLEVLFSTYEKLTTIPGDLLRELEISIENAKASLRLKVSTLKTLYWKELFDGLDSITDKLCHESREQLLSKLMDNTHVDFSENNALAIVIWVIKQANIYFDQQFLRTYERLTELANVVKYKSNNKTFQKDDWRYGDDRYSRLGEYFLDYRVVLENAGGYKNPNSVYSDTRCGLAGSAAILLDDLTTIAQNVGFDAKGNIKSTERTWLPGKPQLYYFYDHTAGEKKVLFEVKAFKNNNLHIKLNQRFIQKINIVHGRLKGWLRSAEHATQEMDVTREVAQEAFNVQFKISVNDVPLLRLVSHQS